jgi:hypothetical protein
MVFSGVHQQNQPCRGGQSGAEPEAGGFVRGWYQGGHDTQPMEQGDDPQVMANNAPKVYAIAAMKPQSKLKEDAANTIMLSV